MIRTPVGRWLVAVAAGALMAMQAAAQGPAPAASTASAASDSDREALRNEVDRVKVVGPAQVVLRDQARLALPAGRLWIPQPAAAKIMTAMGNRPDERLLGLVYPTDDDDWIVVAEYEPAGYVKDDDARDWNADDLLQSLKDGTDSANEARRAKGFAELEVTGWAEKPAYDAATHRLVWAANAKEKGSTGAPNVVNYNTYALGRDGFVSLNLLTDSAHLDADKVPARELLSQLNLRRRQALRRLRQQDRPHRRIRPRRARRRRRGEEARAPGAGRRDVAEVLEDRPRRGVRWRCAVAEAESAFRQEARHGRRAAGARARDAVVVSGAAPSAAVIKLLLLLLSGAKLGKLFASGGTMLLSLAVYALLFGWKYAAGFVALLFAHEMGHYLAARQRGLAVGLPTFIPFVGAWIDLKEQPRDVETEAYVALAGPLLGTVAAIACWLAADADGPRWLMAVAYSGFFLNLFNLLPLSPLDGGRVTAVLSPRIWFAGVPLLGAMFLWHPNPLLLIIGLLAIPQLMKAWNYDPSAPENARYYAIAPARRLEYLGLYFGLAAYLAFMAYRTHELIGAAAG